MFIKPDWPVPEDIIAFTTTKLGGVSKGDFESLNLSLNVGDDPLSVRKNRKLVEKELPYGTKIKWLQQVHGGAVTRANSSCLEKADASWTNQSGWACAIQTADCLPVLFCDVDSTCVAAAHVGWRGLLCDVLDNLIMEIPANPARMIAWLGPRIGPKVFEIGEEVRDEISAWILHKGGSSEKFFKDHPSIKNVYLTDLARLAKFAISVSGVSKMYDSNVCSYSEPQLFFSHRRDLGRTGRMVTLIALHPKYSLT